MGSRLNCGKFALAGLLVIMTLLAMIGPAHADHVTITPSSADTTLDDSNQLENFGGTTYMYVVSGAHAPAIPSRSLVKFDLSSIPLGSTINIAYLQLSYEGHGANDPVGRTYTANRVTTDWVEGTLNGAIPPPGGGATWITEDGTTNWGSPGGDFTTTGAASQTVPAALGVYMTWTVTDIVKAWIEGGQPNYGFLVKDPNEGVGTFILADFYSKEHGSDMPTLEIDYTPPTPTMTASPSSLTITAGQSGSTTITVSGSGGFYGPVVSCTGLAGVTCTTSPSPLPGFTLPPDYSFQLIINTSPSTPQGTFQVTVTLIETVNLGATGIIAPPIFSIQGGSIGPQQLLSPPTTKIAVTILPPSSHPVGGKLLPIDPFSEAAWAVALAILILIPVIVFTHKKPLVQ